MQVSSRTFYYFLESTTLGLGKNDTTNGYPLVEPNYASKSRRCASPCNANVEHDPRVIEDILMTPMTPR